MFFYYWLIAIMPLDRHPFWGWQLVGTFTIVKVLGLVCFVIALGHMLLDGAPKFFRTAPARWFAAFLALQLLSYPLQGGRLANGVIAYSHLYSILSLFLATVVLVNSQHRLRYSLLVTMGATGFASLYAIRQWQEYSAVYEGFRPGGMLGDANEYTLVMNLWMPLAFMWAFGRRPQWHKWLSGGCFAVMLVGTTFAASRGGFLGLAAAFLFLICRSPNRLRNLALVGAFALPLWLLSPVSPLHRFTQPGYGDNQAKEARLVAWRAGWRMIQDHPVIGVGLHNFKPMMPRYTPRGTRVVTVAHNTYLEIAAETGIPGLIAFIGMLGAALLTLEHARRRAQRARSAELDATALALGAGLVSYLVSACFISGWWEKMLWLLLFLTLSLSAASERALGAVLHGSRRPPTERGERHEVVAVPLG